MEGGLLRSLSEKFISRLINLSSWSLLKAVLVEPEVAVDGTTALYRLSAVLFGGVGAEARIRLLCIFNSGLFLRSCES